MPALQSGSWRKGRKGRNREITPTVMLQKGSAQVYAQGGHFFGPTGTHITPPPDWALEAVSKLPKEQQESLGFELKFGKLKSKMEADAEAKPATTPAPTTAAAKAAAAKAAAAKDDDDDDDDED